MTQPMEPLTKTRAAVVIFAAALLMSGAAHAQSPGAGLSNLFGNIFSGPNSTPPAAPQSGSGPLPWSGEAGASGHPLMTAGAIRDAAANFDHCVAPVWPDVAGPKRSLQNRQSVTARLPPD